MHIICTTESLPWCFYVSSFYRLVKNVLTSTQCESTYSLPMQTLAPIFVVISI